MLNRRCAAGTGDELASDPLSDLDLMDDILAEHSSQPLLLLAERPPGRIQVASCMADALVMHHTSHEA